MDEREFLEELRQMVVRRASSEHLVDTLPSVDNLEVGYSGDAGHASRTIYRDRHCCCGDSVVIGEEEVPCVLDCPTDAFVHVPLHSKE